MLLGHHPSNEQIITKVATCNEDGTAVIICDICKKEIETVTIQKTNQHSFNNGICTVCGYKDPSSNTFVAFKVRTLVELHIRKGPGLNYDVIRNLPYYSTITVYETSVADGYTWYRIDKNEWVANDGTWLEYIE